MVDVDIGTGERQGYDSVAVAVDGNGSRITEQGSMGRE
jgi:hypothetical protein